VSGIRYAADHGANVLNLSLGGRFGSTSEQQALQYALSKDVLPFCATGNDGSKTAINYPAKFPECVAVGATDWSDTKASYSNAGAEIDVAAPGGDNENANGYSYILSTYNDGGYGFVAGTSQATPQATGLGGLLYATGMRGAANIRDRIQGTADDLGTAGWDKSFGAGRINVYRAINNLR
jgi:subtilisin family serine protease